MLRDMNDRRRRLGLPVYRVTLDRPPWIRVDGRTLDSTKLPSLEKSIEAHEALQSDPQYTRLEQLWKDPDWLRRNVVPPIVLNVASALNHAREYLQHVRGFRYPTWDVNVYIPKGGVPGFGYEDDLWFGHPFILVNRAKIPAALPGTPQWTPRDQSCYNGLNVTMVHELFHVVQTRYYWSPDVFGTDTWFFEATAVTLEGEARKTYLSKSSWNVTGWHGTVRDYSGFRDQLAFAWQSTHQHQ